MKISERAFRTYVFAKYPEREAVDLCRFLDEVIRELSEPSCGNVYLRASRVAEEGKNEN